MLCIVLISLGWLLASMPVLAAQTAAASTVDPFGRENPRSSVTSFLLACRNQDYQRASNYLDLRHLSKQNRDERGPGLARDLEAILNSSPTFNVLRLTQDPDGDHSDAEDPNREPVANISQNGATFTLALEHVSLQKGSPPVWIFANDTVAGIPQMTPSAAPPAIAHYLPSFLVRDTVLETSLWKWLALALALIFLISLGRMFDHMLRAIVHLTGRRVFHRDHIPIAEIAIGPARLVFSLAILGVALKVIALSAISRLYVGRAIQLVVVCTIAYFLIRLVELLLERVEAALSARQQYASRSMLHLARRAANATIIVLGILLVLSNWGYDTTTLVAGLGVGGIAVALAAQQTIANVFGGVSIIGDQPVRIGDFGKFGDLIGTVEDIGMRSTRIRTRARTVVSVPNSSFAGLNIENYSVRDKMLFNAMLGINRSTPPELVDRMMKALKQKLEGHKSVEAEKSMIRVTGLTSSAVNVEIFCYVLASDWDEFYSVQGDLYLIINEVLRSTEVELT